MSDSVRPHRRQPTRLFHPWDSPGKNTEVGCHFLLQCMRMKSESEVAQSFLTLCDPMDCSLPGSSIHGSFQLPACHDSLKIPKVDKGVTYVHRYHGDLTDLLNCQLTYSPGHTTSKMSAKSKGTPSSSSPAEGPPAASKTKVKEQIKIIVEDLELVLGDLKDVAKELKEGSVCQWQVSFLEAAPTTI